MACFDDHPEFLSKDSTGSDTASLTYFDNNLGRLRAVVLNAVAGVSGTAVGVGLESTTGSSVDTGARCVDGPNKSVEVGSNWVGVTCGVAGVAWQATKTTDKKRIAPNK